MVLQYVGPVAIMSLRVSLKQDTIKTLCARKPVEIGPDVVVGQAVSLMQKHAVGSVIVTEHGKPVGIFTERDILMKVLARNLPADTPIGEVITSSPKTVPEDCSVAEVIRRMHRGGFRHMPVVDASQRLTGVISIKRIVQYLVEHFPSAVFNLPPDPVQKQQTREGA